MPHHVKNDIALTYAVTGTRDYAAPEPSPGKSMHVLQQQQQLANSTCALKRVA